MEVKDSTVNIWGLQVEMQPVLKAAGNIWEKYGQELVITSGRDSIHSAASLHYYGLAVDLRTRYFTEDELSNVAHDLRAALGEGYDVIVHKSHIHVEFDEAKMYI